MGAHNIRVRVDKATLKKWAGALAPLRRRFVVPLVPIGNVAGLPALPTGIGFSGLKLLQDVGLATTRPNVLDDPARHFALLKYASSLSDVAKFALHRDAKKADAHKKKVASDEFGCGFAFLVARRVLNAKHFLDLRTAVDDGIVALPTAISKQPDYIASGHDRTRLIALEAKGTQSGVSDSKRQVTAGCKQVAACTIADATYSFVARAAVGISLAREEQRVTSVVHISDPPEDARDPLVFSEDVARALIASHYARAAAFAGDDDLAIALRQRGERRPDALLERATAGNRKFVGSRLRLHTSDDNSAIELFLGLDAEVRGYLLERDMDAAVNAAGAVDRELAAHSPELGRRLRAWNDVTVYPRRDQPDLYHPTPGERPVSAAAVPSKPTRDSVKKDARALQPEQAGESVASDVYEPAVTTAEDGTWLELIFSGEAAQEIARLEEGRHPAAASAPQ